jgi:hypothetical protein
MFAGMSVLLADLDGHRPALETVSLNLCSGPIDFSPDRCLSLSIVGRRLIDLGSDVGNRYTPSADELFHYLDGRRLPF